MARRDLSKIDASSHAASELEYIIRSEKEDLEPKVPTISAHKAMTGKRMFESKSTRNVTRVLFISRNTELLNPTQQTLDGYINISDLFAEVHILILREGIESKTPVLRVADNVYMYTATSKFWWRTPSAGMKMVESQLEFAAGFRPDLIVARDAFESAVVAYKLGKKYHRPTQLHIMDDYSTRGFANKARHNFWRLFLPFFTVPKFASVRTLTDTVLTMLQKKFVIPDVAMLPRYQNYESLIDIKPTISLKDKYKPFVFTLIFVGKLGHESTLYRAIDAARFVLKNPRVGMVVIGDGLARSEFEKRAKLLGISEQIVFESKIIDIIPYLKSANILLVTDIDSDSEELVLKGAASGIPMIMARTEAREDLFSHGETAFLCDAADVQAFTDRIDDLLNDVALRKQFITGSQDIILEKFHHDPSQYQETYRASIEQAFFVESDSAVESNKLSNH